MCLRMKWERKLSAEGAEKNRGRRGSGRRSASSRYFLSGLSGNFRAEPARETWHGHPCPCSRIVNWTGGARAGSPSTFGPAVIHGVNETGVSDFNEQGLYPRRSSPETSGLNRRAKVAWASLPMRIVDWTARAGSPCHACGADMMMPQKRAMQIRDSWSIKSRTRVCA